MHENSDTKNIDFEEVEKFDQDAPLWWDRNGPYKTLHQINPLRLKFIQDCVELDGKLGLDIGCGGGILTEALARENAQMSAIDMSLNLIKIAKLHSIEEKLNIDYQYIRAEEFAEENISKFDIIVCMELLEHVPDASSIIKAASSMLKPGGSIFFSTLNRNIKSFITAIVGAEYILNMVPRGTHSYSSFIKPSELNSTAKQFGLTLKNISGISYNPVTSKFALTKNVDVNYMMHFIKDSDDE